MRCGLVVFALCLVLAGCGTQGYPQAARDEIGTLRAAQQAYDTQKPHDLPSQESACQAARAKLGDKALPVPTSHYAREGEALNRAYRMARLGFQQCETAARTDNYPRMVTAMSTFQQANTSIARAKSLAR